MGLTIRPKGLTEAHLKAARIGQDYWEQDFLNFEGPIDARKKATFYLRKVEQMKEQGVGLLFVGPHGPGKTTLAMIIMKYLCRAGWDVKCTALGEIVEEIQKGWKNDNQESTLIGDAKRADYLLIDDVGKEHRGGSGFTETVFDNLIRYRGQHRLPTFLTTNLTKSELRGTYGESTISLLEGKLIPITVQGDDYRQSKLKKAIRGAI